MDEESGLKGQWPFRRGGHRLARPKRWVIRVSLLVLILGLANLGRAGLAMCYAARLPDLPMTLAWPYLMAVGLFWGLALIVCSVGLARFRPWGRWATMVAVTAYEAHTWIDHLLYDANDYARQTWPRDLVLTLMLLVVVWGLLNWPGMQRVFKS